MSAEVTRLSNGLIIVTESTPHLETSALGVWVNAGARHEREDEHGLSHLLEHMAFKGTATRSTQDIAEEIEAVGGELNAATGLESTAYFARVLKGDEGVALGIVADILAAVDRVTAAEVTSVARRLRRKDVSAAVVGAGRKSHDLASRAGERLARVA